MRIENLKAVLSPLLYASLWWGVAFVAVIIAGIFVWMGAIAMFPMLNNPYVIVVYLAVVLVPYLFWSVRQFLNDLGRERQGENGEWVRQFAWRPVVIEKSGVKHTVRRVFYEKRVRRTFWADNPQYIKQRVNEEPIKIDRRLIA